MAGAAGSSGCGADGSLQGEAGVKKEGVAETLYKEMPETSFTRSISNPEAVMRRRRQQKLEKRLAQIAQDPEAG